MLGAIYLGINGMDAYQKGLQTISNNVANLNSLGYKATQVTFEDVFNRGGNGQTLSGGLDNLQAGEGVKFDDSVVDFTQGTLNQTGKGLDLAMQGDGFMVLQAGDQTYYARTGSFAVDPEGFVSLQGTSNHLTVLNGSNQPVALNVDSLNTNPPVATTTVKFSGNLSSTGTTATVDNVDVFDPQGGNQVWTISFTSNASTTPGQWAVAVTDASGATVGTSTLQFDGSVVDPSTQTLAINYTPAGGTAQTVTLDFSSDVTSFSSGTTSTIQTASVDGNAVGSLTGVTIDTSGVVNLAYSNGKTVQDGSVAIADFRDPQQLVRVGDGLFQNPTNSQFRLLASANEGIGTLVTGQLEASNVDLSQEFGDLILIQRGYQASSEVISIANDMLQNLFGIRGQG